MSTMLFTPKYKTNGPTVLGEWLALNCLVDKGPTSPKISIMYRNKLDNKI